MPKAWALFVGWLLILPTLVAPASSVASLYGGKGTAVAELDPDAWKAKVQPSAAVWVVHFYAPSDAAAKRLAPEFKKAAGLSEGLVQFGAVNVEAHSALARQLRVQLAGGVQSVLKVFGEDKSSTPKALKGEKTAKGIAKEVVTHLPSKYITQVGTSNYNNIMKKSAKRPLMLVFTEKTETAPLLKALSLQFFTKVDFGEIRAKRKTGKELAKQFQVKTYPTILLMMGQEAVRYTGSVTLADLARWTESASERLAKQQAERTAAESKVNPKTGKKTGGASKAPRAESGKIDLKAANRRGAPKQKVSKIPTDLPRERTPPKRPRTLEDDDPLVTALDDAEAERDRMQERQRQEEEQLATHIRSKVPEMNSPDTLVTRCFGQKGLCVLAFFEAPPNTAAIEPVEALARRSKLGQKLSKGAALSFGWVDAGKFPSFSASFGADGSPPTQLAIVNAKRLKYVITTIDSARETLERALIGDIPMVKLPAGLPVLDPVPSRRSSHGDEL